MTRLTRLQRATGRQWRSVGSGGCGGAHAIARSPSRFPVSLTLTQHRDLNPLHSQGAMVAAGAQHMHSPFTYTITDEDAELWETAKLDAIRLLLTSR